MSNIRQNLFFAFAYNAAGITIAAGVLYSTFELLPSPKALSSVSLVGNALRLRSVRICKDCSKRKPESSRIATSCSAQLRAHQFD